VAFAVAFAEQVVAPIVGLALAATVGTVAAPIADTVAGTIEVLGEKHKEHWVRLAPVHRRRRSHRSGLYPHGAT
jgi:hypothetical protein